MRFFNIAGPCKPDIHYTLSEAMRIIDQQGYFVIHAPSQTGKTTTVLNLAQALAVLGRFVAVLLMEMHAYV
jgi:Mrp family chromosome partitioning ATPase